MEKHWPFFLFLTALEPVFTGINLMPSIENIRIAGNT